MLSLKFPLKQPQSQKLKLNVVTAKTNYDMRKIFSELFIFIIISGSNARPVKITDLNILGIVAVMLFLYSWLQQYLSNLTLVNLRKSKDGKVVTEDHLMPQGGWFEDVSSPHMLFEVLMYVALMLLMPYSVTMRYAALWVLSNQVSCFRLGC